MAPLQESQPLRNPLGGGRTDRTQAYAPPDASGRPEASSPYAMPPRSARSAANATLTTAHAADTRKVAPRSRKMAAPTMAPTAAIVTSKRPRSRVTRTRTERAAGTADDTAGEFAAAT